MNRTMTPEAPALTVPRALRQWDADANPAVVLLIATFLSLPVLITFAPAGEFEHPGFCYGRNVESGSCTFHLMPTGESTYLMRSKCQLGLATAAQIEKIPGVVAARNLSDHEIVILAVGYNLQRKISSRLDRLYPLVH